MHIGSVYRILALLREHEWLEAVVVAIAGGAKPGEALVKTVLRPHIGKVAEMTGLSNEQVEAVYRATAERIG